MFEKQMFGQKISPRFLYLMNRIKFDYFEFHSNMKFLHKVHLKYVLSVVNMNLYISLREEMTATGFRAELRCCPVKHLNDWSYTFHVL